MCEDMTVMTVLRTLAFCFTAPTLVVIVLGILSVRYGNQKEAE